MNELWTVACGLAHSHPPYITISMFQFFESVTYQILTCLILGGVLYSLSEMPAAGSPSQSPSPVLALVVCAVSVCVLVTSVGLCAGQTCGLTVGELNQVFTERVKYYNHCSFEYIDRGVC